MENCGTEGASRTFEAQLKNARSFNEARSALIAANQLIGPQFPQI